MPVEEKARVIFFVPITVRRDENILLSDIITALVQLSGAVISLSPRVARRSWRDVNDKPATKSNWVIIADVWVSSSDPTLLRVLEKLKRRCEQTFPAETFLTIHPVFEIVS